MENEYKTFKQLVKMLSEVRTKDALQAFYAEVDRSYQHGKITYQDNVILYRIPVRDDDYDKRVTI